MVDVTNGGGGIGGRSVPAVFLAMLVVSHFPLHYEAGAPGMPEAAGASLYFAHVVAGGGYTTVFTFINTGAETSAANLFLTDQAGLPLEVKMSVDGSIVEGASFPLTLPPAGTVTLTASLPGSLQPRTGWARLESASGAPSGVATFHLAEGDELRAAAGVLAASALQSAAIPIDNDGSMQRFAGFAVANPGETEIRLRITILERDGSIRARFEPQELNPLGPKRQIARFVHQYQPALEQFRGSMLLSAPPGEAFVATALNQDRGQFTAVPLVGRPPEWKLVWSDEFDGPDGSGVERNRWNFDMGGGGWGNNELEYYTDRIENAFIQSGSLVIQARREAYGNRNYTSARLKTQGKSAWKYGRFEARLKLPRGQGIWPAFWMLGEDITQAGWPTCGEIDIMENIGREPSIVHGAIHGPGYSGANGITAAYDLPGEGAFADGFHVFAVEWAPEEIRWYVDGNLYQTRTPASLPAGARWVFDHPFFIILNVAVGGNWPGYPDATTEFPQQMLVDYVRVYERQP